MEQVSALDVACPVCEAPAGMQCRWPDNHAHLRGRNHNGRLDEAMRASMTPVAPTRE